MFVWKFAFFIAVFADKVTAIPNPGDNHILQSGILFNFQQKVLVAEKFVNIKFVLPFPPYNTLLSIYLSEIAKKLSQKWTTPTQICQLEYTDKHISTTSAEWIYNVTNTEHNRAKADPGKLVIETEKLLSPTTLKTREKRAMGIALGVGAGIIGLGLGLASGESCFLGVLDGCNKPNGILS